MIRKMRWRLELRPGPRWGVYSVPHTPSWTKKCGEREGKERTREEGREKGGKTKRRERERKEGRGECKFAGVM